MVGPSTFQNSSSVRYEYLRAFAPGDNTRLRAVTTYAKRVTAVPATPAFSVPNQYHARRLRVVSGTVEKRYAGPRCRYGVPLAYPVRLINRQYCMATSSAHSLASNVSFRRTGPRISVSSNVAADTYQPPPTPEVANIIRLRKTFQRQ